jgi:hypothetical protein
MSSSSTVGVQGSSQLQLQALQQLQGAQGRAAWHESLGRLFDGLKHKSDDVKLTAAVKLRRYVAAQASDLPQVQISKEKKKAKRKKKKKSSLTSRFEFVLQESFSKFMNDLINLIRDLVNSSNAFEKVGAMLAIEEVRTIRTQPIHLTRLQISSSTGDRHRL